MSDQGMLLSIALNRTCLYECLTALLWRVAIGPRLAVQTLYLTSFHTSDRYDSRPSSRSRCFDPVPLLSGGSGGAQGPSSMSTLEPPLAPADDCCSCSRCCGPAVGDAGGGGRHCSRADTAEPADPGLAPGPAASMGRRSGALEPILRGSCHFSAFTPPG